MMKYLALVRSPLASWCHHDSLAIWARTMSSSMPHLHAAHWMISSVVPVKLPSIRDRYFAWYSALKFLSGGR